MFTLYTLNYLRLCEDGWKQIKPVLIKELNDVIVDNIVIGPKFCSMISSYCENEQNSLFSYMFGSMKMEAGIKQFLTPASAGFDKEYKITIGRDDDSPNKVSEVIGAYVRSFLNFIKAIKISSFEPIKTKSTEFDPMKLSDIRKFSFSFVYTAHDNTNANTFEFRQTTLLSQLYKIFNNSHDLSTDMCKLISNLQWQIQFNNIKFTLGETKIGGKRLLEWSRMAIWELFSMIVVLKDLTNKLSIIDIIMKHLNGELMNDDDWHILRCNNININENGIPENPFKVYHDNPTISFDFDASYDTFIPRNIISAFPVIPLSLVTKLQYDNEIPNGEELSIHFKFPIIIYMTLFDRDYFKELSGKTDLNIFSAKVLGLTKTNYNLVATKKMFEKFINIIENALFDNQHSLRNEIEMDGNGFSVFGHRIEFYTNMLNKKYFRQFEEETIKYVAVVNDRDSYLSNGSFIYHYESPNDNSTYLLINKDQFYKLEGDIIDSEKFVDVNIMKAKVKARKEGRKDFDGIIPFNMRMETVLMYLNLCVNKTDFITKYKEVKKVTSDDPLYRIAEWKYADDTAYIWYENNINPVKYMRGICDLITSNNLTFMDLYAYIFSSFIYSLHIMSTVPKDKSNQYAVADKMKVYSDFLISIFSLYLKTKTSKTNENKMKDEVNTFISNITDDRTRNEEDRRILTTFAEIAWYVKNIMGDNFDNLAKKCLLSFDTSSITDTDQLALVYISLLADDSATIDVADLCQYIKDNQLTFESIIMTKQIQGEGTQQYYKNDMEYKSTSNEITQKFYNETIIRNVVRDNIDWENQRIKFPLEEMDENYIANENNPNAGAVKTNHSNSITDGSFKNMQFAPNEIHFGNDVDLNRSFAMLNEMRGPRIVDDDEKKIKVLNDECLAYGRLFFDVEDIEKDNSHRWDDAKFYMGQLIAVIAALQSFSPGEGLDNEIMKTNTKKLLDGMIITYNPASAHGYSYHFYLPLIVKYSDIIKILNSKFISWLRDEEKQEQAFKFIDPLVYLDNMVNCRLMYYNKGCMSFEQRSGDETDPNAKAMSNADRRILATDEKVMDYLDKMQTYLYNEGALIGENYDKINKLMYLISDVTIINDDKLKQSLREIFVEVARDKIDNLIQKFQEKLAMNGDRRLLIERNNYKDVACIIKTMNERRDKMMEYAKLSKKTLTRPIYTTAFDIIVNKNKTAGTVSKILIANNGKNYHTFYKVGAQAIVDANKISDKNAATRALIRQTMINDFNDVNNKELPVLFGESQCDAKFKFKDSHTVGDIIDKCFDERFKKLFDKLLPIQETVNGLDDKGSIVPYTKKKWKEAHSTEWIQDLQQGLDAVFDY